MNKGKIEIGIAGVGWIATNAHIPALLNNENVTIKAVYDTCFERAEKVYSQFGIKQAFQEFQPFLECGLDGVIIATPNYTHVSYSKAALEHKVSVLCEKPTAFKAEEVEEIKNLAKNNGVFYMPGLVNRWRQDIQTIHKLILNGQLGQLKEVSGGWIRKFGVPRPGTWFTNRNCSGGGVLTDLGSHVIDICSSFLGSESSVEEYQLTTSRCNEEMLKDRGAASWFQRDEEKEFELDVEDTAVARIKFSDGKKMNVNLSWLAPVKADCTYFKLRGTKGQAILKTLFGFSNERLWEKDTLEYESNGVKKVMTFQPDDNHSRCAFQQMLSYYVNALIEGKTGFHDFSISYMTVSIIENLYREEIVDGVNCYHDLTEELELE